MPTANKPKKKNSNGEQQCLQLESWGVLRSHSVAKFCTQAEDPAKLAKKTKAASKTAEAPDERATLLAYKTAVAFPVRFSQPGVFLAQSLGVAEPVTSSTATAEKIVAGATTSTPDDAVAAITASSEPGDPAADGSSSSSSSDSASDSDSDSEDEKSEVEAETKTSPPDLSESTVKKEAEVQEVTSKVKEDNHKNKKEDPPICASEAVPEATPAAAVATIEAVQATVEAPSISSEELVDSAPEICTAIENSPKVPSIKGSSVAASTIVPDAQTQFPSKAVTERATSERVPIDVPIGTTHPVSAEASAEAKAATAEVAAETATEISAPVESAEELVDRAPVVAETAGEKLQAEARVKPPEEAAAVAAAEPEEPFDNSTYKNYQHHSYTPYTFVDLDVEMAKFRLPQPSSDRSSPRH